MRLRERYFPRAGEITSGRGESEPSGGENDEQPYADGHTINLVNSPSKLEHLIIPPSQPERIPQAGARIVGRENSKPSGEGNGEPPYAN